MEKTLGRYKILGELGSGGQSIVFRGWDPVINRPVAIKQVKGVGSLAPERRELFLARFFQEAKAAGGLSHPGIVSIYDVGSDESGPYLVMEQVEGPSLAQLLKQGTPLGEAATVRLMLDICSGLAYAHKRGVIHRDIKPANLLVSREGQVKLVDFGIARVPSSNLTQTGEMLGTIHYMSPEQIKGEEVGRKADIFALGIVLYQCLTGDLPFADGSPTTVIFKIVNDPHRPLEAVDLALAGRFSKIIDRALAKTPAQRYASCEELAADLKEVHVEDSERPLAELIDLGGSVAGDPDTVATALTAEKVDAFSRTVANPPAKSKWRIPALAGLVLLVALGAAWFILPSGSAPTPLLPEETTASPEQNLLAEAQIAFDAGKLVGNQSDDALYLARTALALGATGAKELIDRISSRLAEDARRRAQGPEAAQAIAVYDDYLGYFPDDVEILALKNEALRSGAAAQLRAQIRELTNQGQEAISQGRIEQALKAFGQALELDPNDAQLHYLTGRLLVQRSEYDRAATHFERASQLEPLTPSYLLELSDLQERLGRYQAAYDSLNRGLAVGGDSILGEATARNRLRDSRFRMELSKLVPFSSQARHDHLLGSCKGNLETTIEGMSYSPDGNNDHAFRVEWKQVTQFDLRGSRLTIEAAGKKQEFQGVESPSMQKVASLFASGPD